MSKTGIYLLFQANRAYISSYLCEQRQDSASDCQGKCYLKKELKKETKREQQLPGKKLPATDLILMVANSEVETIGVVALGNDVNFGYTIRSYPTVARTIFQPPQLLT
ncbi:hypothetical protein [Pontibacter cellulosilyticus]|uniref:Uncharacterized protein n=1 Tax=Pontibacter cellulosilyticus TaxID=1720253 RepID=A0A923SPV5_9BACT|nr:hypothetical protein [Pontibacter cellulosilyticus]MBC5994525.1 hypothetical protein [Pontibacter cellulosilyticus]